MPTTKFLIMFSKRTLFGALTRPRLFVLWILICSTVILNSNLSPDLYFMYWRSFETTDCHYINTGDILPSAENKYSPAPDSIFFLETSCRGGLLPSQACSIESAARIHPEKEVHVLFSGPVRSYNGTLKTLRSFKNIRFARIHLMEFATGTPADCLVASGALNRSRYRVVHTSDILKLIVLYKWSGVYLDLDALLVKSLNSLAKNWLVRESDLLMACGAMSLSGDEIGRNLTDIFLRNAVANFRGDCWSHNGPTRVKQTLKKFCSTRDVTLMSADTCKGVEVYSSALFYPISWKELERYYMPGTLDWPWVYVYHVWGSLDEVPENSRYANLAKKYCPSIYESYCEDFGRPKSRSETVIA